MRGDFEIHLTVLGAGIEDVEGLTFSDIVRDRGDHPRRSVLTYRARGSARDVIESAHDEKTLLRDLGLHPVRLRIEAVADIGEEPSGDEPRREHRLELRLPDTGPERLAALASLIEPHSARLFHDARRPDVAGAAQRFVTQRCHGADRAEARGRLSRLVEALTAVGYEILQVGTRHVIYDTAPELDDGWFSAGDREPRRPDRPRRRPGPGGGPASVGVQRRSRPAVRLLLRRRGTA